MMDDAEDVARVVESGEKAREYYVERERSLCQIPHPFDVRRD